MSETSLSISIRLLEAINADLRKQIPVEIESKPGLAMAYLILPVAWVIGTVTTWWFQG